MNERSRRFGDTIDRPIFWEPSRAFLRYAIGTILAGCVAFVIALHFFAPEQTVRIAASAGFMLLAGAAWVLLARHQMKAAGLTLGIGAWVYVTTVSMLFGGVAGSSVIVYPLIILLTTWLVSERAGLALALLTVAVTGGFVLAESWGFLPAPVATPAIARWVVQASVFIITAVLIAQLVRSYRGRLEEVQALGRDLALRTAEVLAREDDLNRAQAVAHVGSWVYEIAADAMRLSAETCRILGLPEGTSGNRDIFLSCVHPEDRRAAQSAWHAALAGGGAFDHEHRIVAGETLRWVRQTAELEFDAGGGPVRVVGTTQDITERERHQAATLAARNQLAATLDAIPDLLFEVGSDGRYHDYHSPRDDLLAVPAGQLIGKTVREMLPPAAAENCMSALREAGETGRSQGRQFELALAQGRFWFELSVLRKPVDAEEEPRFIVLSRDITERKRVEQRLSMAIEVTQVVLWELDLLRDRLTFDQNMLQMLGLEADAPLDSLSGWIEHIHPEDRGPFQQRVALALQPGDASFEFEYRMANKGGEYQWVHTWGRVARRTAEGRPALAVGTSMNVTARKRAEEALRESENRLSAVFHASPIGISISSLADGRILDANEAALRMYGYGRDEALGRTILELGLYEDPAQREEVLRHLRERGKVDRYPITLRKRSGEACMVEVSVRVTELQGEQYSIVMMLDVTERKRLEEVHLQAQKLESLGTLAGGIAHDFNNILSAIRGNADLAAEDVGPAHLAAESLAEIRKSTARASDLVRRIMAFGRPKEVKHEVVDLGVVVDEVLRLLRSTMPAGISMSTAFAQDAPHVLADSGQVHEAIVNLTTNAAHAIGARAGTIEYRLQSVQVGEELARSMPGLKPGRYARLTVTDSGCGMEETTLARIFDAFYTTKAVGEGTGLGLSMVHGIMRSHGGAVTVESAPGKGSSFSLYFPAVEEKAERKDEAVFGRSEPAGGRRVLYVDDEEALVYLARRVLSRMGHTMSGFTDPKEALAAFRENPQEFDVVVTDLSMPNMSGFELARDILAVRPQMPVLMATGYVRAEDVSEALKIGIRKVIYKPVTVNDLGQALDQLFRTGEAPSGA